MSATKKLTTEMIEKLKNQMLARLKALNVELEEDRDALQDTLPADSKEAAASLDDLAVIAADNERDVDEIDAIRHAMNRISSGDYGACETCQKTIAVERLLAIPQTSLCVTCQSQDEHA